jgi:hypothetical protein
LQQLVPDDFVDQGGAAAAGEQHEEQGQMTARAADGRGWNGVIGGQVA